MLSPSDYNNAVPQFTNGNYASNPLNPLYIEEPSSTDYNRGAEPLQTLPAQWWNWLMNQFTARFNKLNLYVKNIFNELSQLLSIGDITPDGTEASPTVTQIKDFFQTCYPDYMKTTSAIADTYVPKTTMVNGHALSENVTVTRSDLGLGTSATVNTGTEAGCIPTVGTALGTTNGQFLATDSSGNLKPSGYTASCFRSSTWVPTCVACAGAGPTGTAFGTAAYCAATAFRASTWTPTCVACAGANGSGTAFGASATRGVYTLTAVGTLGYDTAANRTKVPDISALAYWNGAYQSTASNLRYYCGGAFGTAAKCAATAFRACTWWPDSINCGCVHCSLYSCVACTSICSYIPYLHWKGQVCTKPTLTWMCITCVCCYSSCVWMLCNRSHWPLIITALGSSSGGIIPPGVTCCNPAICCLCNIQVLGFADAD